MSYEPNIQSRQALNREIKTLRSNCSNYACQIIDNSPPEVPDNGDQKRLCYVEGVRTEIQNSHTPIPTDDNLLTAQFLIEIKEKTQHVEELIAFTKGSIHEMENEIERLNSLITIANDAKKQPKVQKNEVQNAHLMKAKERFHLLKNELHGLICSLYPDIAGELMEILGQLMQEKLKETSSGYIPITSENYKLIELLKDINVVTPNPYNNAEVKIAY